MSLFFCCARRVGFAALVVACIGVVSSETHAAKNINWVKAPGSAVDISIGGKPNIVRSSKVWVINKSKSNNVQSWNNGRKIWDTVSGANGIRIDGHTDGTPLIVTPKSHVMFHRGNRWHDVGIGGRDVAASKELTYMNGFDHTDSTTRSRELKGLLKKSDQAIYYFTGGRIRSRVRWAPFKNIKVAQIDANPLNSELWAVTKSGNIKQLSLNLSRGEIGPFKSVSGSAKFITVGGDGSVWIIKSNNQLAKRKGNGWDTYSNPKKLVTIAADIRGRLWGIDKNGAIFADVLSAEASSLRPKVATRQPTNPATTPTAASATHPTVAKMLRTKKCIKCKLRGFDLRNKDLRKINFTGADLINANLSGANLQDANFTDAKMNGANLSKARGIRPNFTSANLTGATLTGAKLQYAEFSGAILHLANLEKANLDKSALSKMQKNGRPLFAVFYKAKLKGVSFKKARMDHVNFDSSDLQNAQMQGAHLNKAKFPNADLRKANLSNAWLKGTDFRRAKVKGLILKGSTYGNATWDPGVKF